ncbi:metallophosphoesterase family protein [Altericista sp. CCNU0014]|uniref:metallophosphoesterase family protein n=1 Tax=Altericista sp. CCNU0014 TaxID=3082949 RepID=UPI0038511850
MLNDSSRRIVIGDVHGHYKGLQHLFSLLALGDRDAVYFLGDLIDRGPESSQVVAFVRSHQYPCLMGNHEQMAGFAFAEDTVGFAMDAWLAAGGRSTLESYQDLETQLEADLNWFSTLPSHFDLGDYWLVHAGVHPRIPIEQQSSQEFCWIRQEFHQSQTPFFEDKTIVTGHTITFTFPGVEPGQIAKGAGWLDIDTGAYHPRSGWMTALDLTQQQVYQVNVLSGAERVRSLAEATTPIQPSLKREGLFSRRLISRSA